ncbi:MAG: hypothetical protein ACLQPD_32690 [Desulfomonilaceae bacterium]
MTDPNLSLRGVQRRSTIVFPPDAGCKPLGMIMLYRQNRSWVEIQDHGRIPGVNFQAQA